MQTDRPFPRRFLAASIAGLALGGLISACGRGGDPANADAAQGAAPSSGYAAPPSLLAAERRADGVVLRGSAQPGAVVTLAAPDATMLRATADRRGMWTAHLSPTDSPRLYALWSDAPGRRVRAEGAVAVLPAPSPPALLLRAGFAAQAPPARVASPRLMSVDYDAAGGIAAGGLAPVGSRLRFTVDGEPADLDAPDRRGRFQLLGPKSRPPGPGRHRLAVANASASTGAELTLSPPAPLDGRLMRTAREGEGWRIDWAVPGGGEQTTLVLDPSAATSGSPAPVAEARR